MTKFRQWMWIPIAALAFSTTVQASEAPGVSARAAAVIDVDSNQLLYEKNADQRMLIASLTKVMTAIVALEHDSIADVVSVDQDSYGKEGSSIYLQLGQKISLENLLYGLMLRSGNDAASAIAKHVGGSEAGFVAMMNDTARYIGMRNTHFANPHGLDAPEHYSTARDMALLTAYAMMNPTFREIVKTPYKRITYDDQNVSYLWRNKNKMLRLFEGADGVKTGFTKRAGRCLISSATRDGKQIVVVTLKASSDWVDHRHLLQYGFQRGE